MHAGQGAEGSWFGDDSKEHFELIVDIFDILFNMPEVLDPTKATVGDLLKVTKEQRQCSRHCLDAYLCKTVALRPSATVF